MARRHQISFLQVIYNNGGGNAPKLSLLGGPPDGRAAKARDVGLSFEPSPDHDGIAAAAGGAFARVVTRPAELEPALEEAMDAVRNDRRCAVLDVKLPAL